jgi:lipoyl(octanoyl) transferase
MKIESLEQGPSYFWGRLPYREAEELQSQVTAWLRERDQSFFILGGEVEPVITCGIRARPQHILMPLGFDVVQIKRGGETTLHSPGQLLIYPIVNLKKLKYGVRDFVCDLLRTSQNTFSHFGFETQISDKPVGLFQNSAKVGFCGLQIREGFSRHGLALNISNELSLFSSIISCGLEGVSYTRLWDQNSDSSLREFFEEWVNQAPFGRQRGFK